MKHKVLLISVAVMLVIGLVVGGCAKPAPAPAPAPQKVLKIGVTQIVTHASVDAIREGFISGMAEEGFIDGENVEYDLLNPEGDMSVAKTIANKFVREQKDLIVALTTPCAQAVCAAANGTDIPIVFIAVTDPVLAGIVKSWESPCFPGAHITGVSDYVPVRPQLDIIKGICPDAKVLGTVYNAGDESNIKTLNDLKSLLPEYGLTLIEASVSTTAEVRTAAISLVDRVDAMWFPMDNTTTAAIGAFVSVCQEYEIPLFTPSPGGVEAGGIASVMYVSFDLGEMGAGVAARVLRGEDPCSIPVTTFTTMNIYLNPGVAEKMGATIPQSLLDKAYEIWNGQEWEKVGH